MPDAAQLDTERSGWRLRLAVQTCQCQCPRRRTYPGGGVGICVGDPGGGTLTLDGVRTRTDLGPSYELST